MRSTRIRSLPRLEALEARRLMAADPIGASPVRLRYGVDGRGEAAAVIDTGVNYDHEALGGGFGPGFKVEDGVDFADHHATPLATASQHGTAVAGLIASADPLHPGVAPGADLVALRVFGDSGKGSYADVAAALQWVLDNHARDQITVANISIADGANYTADLFQQDAGIAALIGELAAADIPVVVAAGNSYQGQEGMGFPAIIPATISVAGLDTSGHLAGDTQRLGAALGGPAATDIAAPGTDLIAPVDGDNFTTAEGTSFAAAEVTGAVLLLQQIYQSRFGRLPGVAQLDQWLQAGASPVPGADAGLGRLDLAKSAALIPTPAHPPALHAAGSVGALAVPAHVAHSPAPSRAAALKAGHPKPPMVVPHRVHPALAHPRADRRRMA